MKACSLILVLLLIFCSTGAAAQTARTPQAEKIKAQVQNRGAGEKSKVRVTIGNGTVLKGYISQIGESSFDVNESKSAQATSVSYTDVRKIQGPGLSKGAKIAIGVGAGIAVVAIIIGIKLATTKIGPL